VIEGIKVGKPSLAGRRSSAWSKNSPRFDACKSKHSDQQVRLSLQSPYRLSCTSVAACGRNADRPNFQSDIPGTVGYPVVDRTGLVVVRRFAGGLTHSPYS